jgi:hypothetical protein
MLDGTACKFHQWIMNHQLKDHNIIAFESNRSDVMTYHTTHINWSCVTTELNNTQIRIIVIYYTTFRRMWRNCMVRHYVRSIWFESDDIMIFQLMIHDKLKYKNFYVNVIFYINVLFIKLSYSWFCYTFCFSYGKRKPKWHLSATHGY